MSVRIAGSSEEPLLRHEGEYWTVVYEGTTVRLRSSKGLIYLERLLRHPGRPFHVLDLAERRPATSPSASAVTVERARKAVTNRIRQTVVRIATVHAALGVHLGNAVHTGTRCVYTPDRPTRWAE